MIIDHTFFQSGLLLIKGITMSEVVPSLTGDAITEDLTWYIARYEREYLERLLGESMAFEFIEYLDSESEPVDKWENLKSHLVIDMGKTVKLCPAANYVYYYYLRAHQSDATSTGVKVDDDDGKLVSASQKMVDAWNDMVRLNRKVCAWMESCGDVYKDVKTDQVLLVPINTMNL